MRQIIYAIQFRGRGGQGTAPGVLIAKAIGPSCVITSAIGPEGVEGTFKPAAGGLNADFYSEVRLTGGNSFQETGTITFADGRHRLRFSTIGQGYLGPSAAPKLQSGAVIWRVDGGEGQFEGASGFITSNFTFHESGEVVDNQFGVIFVKGEKTRTESEALTGNQ